MRPGVASTKTCPEKKTGIGTPWAEERRKGPAQVPQALHFTTAERNLQKIKKKENPVEKNKSIQSREPGKGLLQKSQMGKEKTPSPQRSLLSLRWRRGAGVAQQLRDCLDLELSSTSQPQLLDCPKEKWF